MLVFVKVLHLKVTEFRIALVVNPYVSYIILKREQHVFLHFNFLDCALNRLFVEMSHTSDSGKTLLQAGLAIMKSVT